MDQRKGAGSAAGDDLQRSADTRLHPVSQCDQLVHLVRGGLSGAVAGQVNTDTGQVYMGQVLLHPLADVHQLILVPEALTQVAQVGHHDDAVGPVLAETLLLQRQQGGPLALQGRVAQSDHVRQLRQAGDADQEPGAGHTGGTAFGHLLQAAGAQLCGTGSTQRPGDLRQAIRTLDNAADTDTRGIAAGDHRPGIALQQRKIDL